MSQRYEKPQGSLISYFSNLVKAKGGINLAQGIPGFNPPYELTNLLAQLAKENIHQYAPGKGNSKLLKLISKMDNTEVKNILMVQGATEAIVLIYIYLSRKFKEFNVLSFDPAYESYIHLPDIFNHRFFDYKPDENHEINISELEENIKKNHIRLLMISSPGNPYGKGYDRKLIETLDIMASHYDFYILFDAVYRDLYFNEPTFCPLVLNSKRIFYVNSFSKMLSITGWRIGYLIAPDEHIRAIESIHDYIGLCAPSILQETIAEYLTKYNFGNEYLAVLRSKLKQSFDLLSATLKELGFTIPKTDGGYFIWSRLPGQYTDGFQFAMELYNKHKVASIPGIHFSKSGSNYIRWNIARDKKEIQEAAVRIKTFITQ